MKILLTAAILHIGIVLSAQQQFPQVEILSQGTPTSLRGISVVTDQIVWVSGSKGTIGKSTNGGKTWKWMTVKGFEKKDFRDIEAFDANRAVIMAVDSPAYILRTVDGGTSWKLVYQNNTSGIFLDAMEFWNEQSGIIIGDPINNRFQVIRSFDNGATWKELTNEKLPVADSGEACFAASGTNIRSKSLGEAAFVTGGLKSRLFFKDKVLTLPIIQGSTTTGANSLAIYDNGSRKGGSRLIVVGGDFNKPSDSTLNCFISTNSGKSWKAPQRGPRGYRSCVEFVTAKEVVTCGLTGVDFSSDGGMSWKPISDQSFHTCRQAKAGYTVFFAGEKGTIGKLIFYPHEK